MKKIVFLTKDQILHLHKNALEDDGGSPGVRDMFLLESAISQPEASWGGDYLNDFPFAMAASYFFHISQNQPFMDGNKRTGFLSMFTFLEVNGYTLDVPEALLYPCLIEVAEGVKGKDELATFIEQYSIKTRI